MAIPRTLLITPPFSDAAFHQRDGATSSGLSPCLPACSMAGHLVKCIHFIRPPLAWSVKMRLHPARFKAVSCKLEFWSSVNGRGVKKLSYQTLVFETPLRAYQTKIS